MVYAKVDSFTKNRPSFRKLLNYSFAINILTTAVAYPLFVLIYNRSFLKGLRGALILCVFSMANDVIIDFKRKGYIMQNYTHSELRENFVKNRMIDIRAQVNEDLKDGNLSFL